MRQITWKYGHKISEAAIDKLESALGVRLPADYREVVLQHDGARPRPCAVSLPSGEEVVFERLIRVADDAGEASRETVQLAIKAVGPAAEGVVVPFAMDPFGNLFCMLLGKDGRTKIVYRRHETQKATELCLSFSELLDRLHEPRVGK